MPSSFTYPVGELQDVLAFVPRPVYAVLLLFPIDEHSEITKREGNDP